MRKSKILFTITMMILSAISFGNVQNKQDVPSPQSIIEKHSISVDFAKRFIESSINDTNFVLLDVRRPDEYEQGHIRGAKNINFLSADFKKKVSSLDKNKKYLLYCRSGHRSGMALQVFLEMGFKQVYNMKGGIIQWKNKNYPLVTE